LPKEVTQQVDLDSIRIQYISKGLKLKDGEGGKFKPGDENPMGKQYEFIEPLSLIVKEINEKYGTDFNDADKIVVDVLMSRVSLDEEFGAEVKTNPKENVWWAFQRKFNGELQNLIEEHFDFYKKINNDQGIKDALMRQMFNTLYEQMIKKAG